MIVHLISKSYWAFFKFIIIYSIFNVLLFSSFLSPSVYSYILYIVQPPALLCYFLSTPFNAWLFFDAPSNGFDAQNNYDAEIYPSHSQMITLGLLRENVEKLHRNARLINSKCHPVLWITYCRNVRKRLRMWERLISQAYFEEPSSAAALSFF